MKILILCSSTNKPVGGNRVLYRYCDLLNDFGLDAYILHPIKNFRCTWFKNNTKVYNKNFLNAEDHLIFPETEIILNIERLKKIRNKYSIFVQNGYFITDYINNYNQYLDFYNVYNNASFIIAISNDTKEMIKRFFSISNKNILIANYSMEISNLILEDQADKENIITYMPRKNYKHAQKVITGIISHLPKSWKIIPIFNMNSKEVGNLLNRSKIFLSFEGFGGKPLPPIEAALSTNYVIGYHGQGGKEYWDKYIFKIIEPFNIGAFIDTVIQKIDEISSKNFDFKTQNKNFKNYKHTILNEFSNHNEKKSILEISIRIKNDKLSENVKVRNIFQQLRIFNIINNLLIMRNYNKKNKRKYLEIK